MAGLHSSFWFRPSSFVILSSLLLLASSFLPNAGAVHQKNAGPEKVGGLTHNLAMPPLPQLTDKDVAAVLTYIRRVWEHTASTVEPNAVTAVHEQNKGRMAMWTEQELKNLGKKTSSRKK